jgi:hypothetical protein
MTAKTPAPFIVGVPRSGTTLLRLMLDAHPDLAIPFETHFISAFVGRDRLQSPTAQEFSRKVIATPYWRNLGISADEFRFAVDSIKPFSVAEGLRVIYRLYAGRFGKRRWGDKTPPYLKSMSAIQGLLPEAHFIHIVRDGRDIALSSRKLWFGPGEDIETAAEVWINELANARRQANQLEHYIELKYEALVYDPEYMLRTVCQYLRLDYSPSMLGYFEVAKARLSEVIQAFGQDGGQHGPDLPTFLSIHDRTSQPPDPTRIGQWKTQMSRNEQNRFESIAGRWLTEFNYEPGTSSESAQPE